jgi:hypothetical protein
VRTDNDKNCFRTGSVINGWLTGMWTGRSAFPSQGIWQNVGEGGTGTGGWARRGSRVETEVDGEVLMTSQVPLNGCRSCCADSGTKQL